MSQIWIWILAYAVALVGLQMLVYYYYLRQGGETSLTASTASGERPPSGSRRYTAPLTEEERKRASSGRQCRHCGTINESNSVYRYCRDCGGELGP